MKIVKAMILVRDCYPDHVELTTTLKSPFPGDGKLGKLGVKFTTPCGKGESYVKQKFCGIPIEVVELKDTRKFGKAE